MVTGSAAARALAIEEGQLARFGIQSESVDSTGFLILANSVQKAVFRVDGEKRRLLSLGGQLGSGQAARGRIQLQPVNPFAG